MSLKDDGTFIAVACLFVVTVFGCVVPVHRRMHVFDGIRPTGVFLSLFLLIFYLNAIPFVLQETPDDSDLACLYLGVLLVMFIGIFLGFGLADRVITPAGRGQAAWTIDVARPPYGASLFFWGITFTFGAVAVYHFVASNGYTAITEFATSEGEARYLSGLRTEVCQPREGGYLANLARFAILPALALATVSRAMATRTLRTTIVAIVFWAAVEVFRMATLAKAPATFWLLAILLVWATQRRAKRPLLVMGFGVAAFALMMSFLYAFIYGQALSKGWNDLTSRATWIPQSAVLLFLQTFPRFHPHLLGQSISFVQLLSGGDQVRGSYEYVMDWTHATGTPNSAFIGDAWADFAWYGVVGLSILVGFTIRGLESAILRMPRTPLFHGLYVAVLLAVVDLVSSSFWTTLLTHGLGLAPIIVFTIWVLGGRRPGPAWEAGGSVIRPDRFDRRIAAGIDHRGIPREREALL
jgi:hypothetical protein